MDFAETVETVGKVVDIAGVSAIVIGILLSTAVFARNLRGGSVFSGAYSSYRRQIGRAILLGLELLVAADIIRTIVIDPNLESVAVLGGIVLIRTFLSFTLELEITGRWPWQHKPGES